ncbi:hypothetical protein I3842_13G146600 [Carya illinoinensis]|uniref:Uncharacterized protein n=1 Tax=Carya illinoinensis TaxID=32201 RepID=A0A922AJT0_CARIL|nr:hypothetical protein I3842_13G146600 [Carya illinoinensis]
MQTTCLYTGFLLLHVLIQMQYKVYISYSGKFDGLLPIVSLTEEALHVIFVDNILVHWFLSTFEHFWQRSNNGIRSLLIICSASPTLMIRAPLTGDKWIQLSCLDPRTYNPPLSP